MQAIEELEKALKHLEKAQGLIEKMPDSEHIRWARPHTTMATKYAEFAVNHLKQEKEER